MISDSCGKVLVRGLDEDEKELVTRLHNERRAFVANGLEKRGDPGPQPPAANMMEMVKWCSTLCISLMELFFNRLGTMSSKLRPRPGLTSA